MDLRLSHPTELREKAHTVGSLTQFNQLNSMHARKVVCSRKLTSTDSITSWLPGEMREGNIGYFFPIAFYFRKEVLHFSITVSVLTRLQ